ncbi:MAG: hypothetical protein LBD70_05190 [Bifidobacteriaceae bacterium]|nr:hypothetical protein [Bifidobacteriaceae bacterium]
MLRFAIREGADAAEALQLPASFERDPNHQFWSDSLPYRQVSLAGVIGHRQVADATWRAWRATAARAWPRWTPAWPPCTQTSPS